MKEPYIVALEKSLKSKIYTDSVHTQVYSVDASIFEIAPQCVIIPEDVEEIQKIVKIASKYRVPITARGAATSTTGAALGKGIVLDMTPHFNDILEINPKEKWVRVQPGVIQEDLNQALSPYGYRLGPDTSSGLRASIGGMVCNNSSGARSLKYGTTYDALLEVSYINHHAQLTHLKSENSLEKTPYLSKLHKRCKELLKQHENQILKNFPPLEKQASGYCLDKLLAESPFNLAKLFSGSEGTLGILVEVKLKIIKKPSSPCLWVFQCKDLNQALDLVVPLKDYKPLSLELIDQHILSKGWQLPHLKSHLDWLLPSSQALLIFEEEKEDREKFLTLKRIFKDNCLGIQAFSSPEAIEKVWELRKSGLGILMNTKSFKRGYAFIEDLVVPPKSLKNFIRELNSYLKKHHKEAGIYGHAGAGLVHVRPFINLKDEQEEKLMRQMMEEVAELILKYRGSLSGEHGDGYLRSYLNKKIFQDNVYTAFKKIKQLFDPQGIFNPDKIIASQAPFDQTRISPRTQFSTFSPFLNFSKEGGFHLAADLCNGNALCRKKEGLMCPSYQATLKEKDSTRARAQVLRSFIHQKISAKEFLSKESFEVFDLCLQCKGCKVQCPSQVDISKFKSEFLYQYYQQHTPDLKTKIFSHFDRLCSWASPFPNLVNSLGKSQLIKPFLNLLGISTELSLPLFSSSPFSSLLKKEKMQKRSSKKVGLFIDTYTQYFRPEIGIKAIKILNAMDVEVEVLPIRCCGRLAYSKGFLDRAKKQASSLINSYDSFLKKGYPILGLEPSCTYMIKEEISSLISHPNTEKLKNTMQSFEQYLQKNLSYNNPFHPLKTSAIIHTHCHQKSSCEKEASLKLLKQLESDKNLAIELPSGCCGMAGSFGYEKEKLSKAIYQCTLKPHLKKHPEVSCIANGFSCQHQIAHHEKRQPQHIVEFLFEYLR